MLSRCRALETSQRASKQWYHQMVHLTSSGMIIAEILVLLGGGAMCVATAVDTDADGAGLGLGLTPQVRIEGGAFWFGTQITLGEESKVVAFKSKDGALPRKPKTVEPFFLDESTVTNAQFQAFVHDSEYRSEAEKFGWSFVLEPLATKATVEACDKDLGRVQKATHWLAVRKADWRYPHGPLGEDSVSPGLAQHPVVQMSHSDAEAYCEWADRRLPTEVEWEFAARGGLVNVTYPWGDTFDERRLNIWEGTFPAHPTSAQLVDGFLGTAPAQSYPANAYGLYSMLGNVWEWVKGGTKDQRTLRGGSFVDSRDGDFNHVVLVSTRQTNTGDSAADNIGFRCARSDPNVVARKRAAAKKRGKKPKKVEKRRKSTDPAPDTDL